jgi:hypothetical protein
MVTADVKLKYFLAGVVVAMIPVGFYLAEERRLREEDRAKAVEFGRALAEQTRKDIEDARRRLGVAGTDNQQFPPEAGPTEIP